MMKCKSLVLEFFGVVLGICGAIVFVAMWVPILNNAQWNSAISQTDNLFSRSWSWFVIWFLVMGTTSVGLMSVGYWLSSCAGQANVKISRSVIKKQVCADPESNIEDAKSDAD